MRGLHVFGYTAHPRSSKIGQMIDALNRRRPNQWAVRFSVKAGDDPAPMQATTVWGAADREPGSIICPAQREKAHCCGTCGLCWWPAAAKYRIAFLGHDMSKMGRAGHG